MNTKRFKKVFSLLLVFLIFIFTLFGCNDANKNSDSESGEANIIKNIKTIKVLCLGSSFSNNSTQYASQMVLSFGGSLQISSLYYQGCSPQQHLDFYNKNQNVYDLYTNGVKKQSGVTMKQVLEAQQYDYITFQCGYGADDNISSYDAIIPLSQVVRDYQSNAEFLLHQTWSLCAERLSSSRIPGTKQNYSSKNKGRDFFDLAKANYETCAENLGGIKIVPIGEAVQISKEDGGFTNDYGQPKSLYSDLISHLSEYGKYLSAAVWTQYFYGNEIDVRQSEFVVAGVDEQSAKTLKEIAYKVVNEYKK